MKVYTDAVYNMRMCMKEDNLCSKSISREIISSAGQGYCLNTDIQTFIT